MGKKMRKRPNDKMRLPQDNKGGASLEDLRAEADAALHLLDGQTADAIIGEQTPEFKQLIRGANALMGMSWAVMKTHGLLQVPATLKAQSQTLLMVTMLIHQAYALGIQRERESPDAATAARTVGDDQE